MRLKSDEIKVLFALHGGNLADSEVPELREVSILRKFRLKGMVDGESLTPKGQHIANRELEKQLHDTPVSESESNSVDVPSKGRKRVQSRIGRADDHGDSGTSSDRVDEPGQIGPTVKVTERSDDAGGGDSPDLRVADIGEEPVSD